MGLKLNLIDHENISKFLLVDDSVSTELQTGQDKIDDLEKNNSDDSINIQNPTVTRENKSHAKTTLIIYFTVLLLVILIIILFFIKNKYQYYRFRIFKS